MPWRTPLSACIPWVELDVIDAEQDGGTGDHRLFGRDAGDQGHGDLPEAQADGGEEGHEPLAQQGAVALAHLGGVAAWVEVRDEPHEDGRHEG